MADRTASRTSFLDPIKPAEAPASATPSRIKRTVQVRHTPAARPPPQVDGGPPGAQHFVFSTPGSGGVKASRCGRKKGLSQGRTPGTPWDEGSPMQWSPMDASDASSSTPLGSTSASRRTPGGKEGFAENLWVHPGSNANIASPASGPNSAPNITVELLSRLHLGSGSENLEHRPSSAKGPAAAQAAAPASPGPATFGEVAPQPSVGFVVGAGSPAHRNRQEGSKEATTVGSVSFRQGSAKAAADDDISAPAFVFGSQEPAASGPFVPGGAGPRPGFGKSPAGIFQTAAQPFVFGSQQPAAPPAAAPKPASTAAREAAAPSQPQPASTQAAPQQRHQQPTQPSSSDSRPFVFVAGPDQAPPAPVPASFVYGVASQQASAGPASAPSFVFGQQQAPATDLSQAQQHEQQGAEQGPSPAAGPTRKGAAAARRHRARKASSASPSQAAHSASGFSATFLAPLHSGATLFAEALAAPLGTSPAEVQQQQQQAGVPPPPPFLADFAQEMIANASSETHRNQGNEAFKNQDYETAAEFYTKAIKALYPYPSLHPRLALLLSNRAAALLSLGKPFQALVDCRMGLEYDPKFVRCALRIATCHYRLGDFAAAEKHLRAMQQSAAGDACVLSEVSSKLEEVQGHRKRVLSTLSMLGHDVPISEGIGAIGSGRAGGVGQRGSGSKEKDEETLRKGMAELEALWAHVPHAEVLHAAKASALLRLGKFVQAVEASKAKVHLDDSPASGAAHAQQPWRLWVEAQCAFHEGNYVALAKHLRTLQQEQKRREEAAAAAASPFGGGSGAALQQEKQDERSSLLAAVVPLPTAAELAELVANAESAQRLRLQGNELMQQSKYAESVTKYSEALAVTGLSAAFASILHSNRAAAHQGVEQWAQAVADCCRSKALAPTYTKALSRLAVLLTELRLHEAAVRALESALQVKGLSPEDRRSYERRLQEARLAASRKSGPRLMGSGGGPPQANHYKLLMLERSCSDAEVRKAYKKLALQLHPDKVVSTCRYSERLWERGAQVLPAAEAQARLQEDAKWLFQCLGEAHEVLTDKTRRQELDMELRMEERSAAHPSAYGFDTFGSRYGSGARDPYFGTGGGGGSNAGYGAGRAAAGDWNERLRRAAQDAKSRRYGSYGYGYW